MNKVMKIILLALLVTSTASATPFLNAIKSDPQKIGWMKGFPPAEDKTIRGTDKDYFTFPKMRWTVCHFNQLMPTVEVQKRGGSTTKLVSNIDRKIGQIKFKIRGKRDDLNIYESLYANYTDGLVVLHKGKIVYEKYLGCLDQYGKHGAMSVTKSFSGLLAEILISEGKLDESKLVSEIIPELKDSAFGSATVRQVMDMTTGLKYSEDYSDPNADVWKYTMAASPLPKPKGYKGPRTYFDFLQTVKQEGSHGDAFAYKTINTDTLGWILSRVSGMPLNELLSEKLWSKMGAEQNAYFNVDSIGTPFAGGGMSAGLRDMARVGQLMLNKGTINGKRVFKSSVVDSISKGGDKSNFAKAGYKGLKGGSYRSMWWVFHNENGAYAARGVHGQTIYVDPKAEMVIARFASHPVAKNGANDPTSLPAYDAIAKYLMKK